MSFRGLGQDKHTLLDVVCLCVCVYMFCVFVCACVYLCVSFGVGSCIAPLQVNSPMVLSFSHGALVLISVSSLEPVVVGDVTPVFDWLV